MVRLFYSSAVSEMWCPWLESLLRCLVNCTALIVVIMKMKLRNGWEKWMRKKRKNCVCPVVHSALNRGHLPNWAIKFYMNRYTYHSALVFRFQFGHVKNCCLVNWTYSVIN